MSNFKNLYAKFIFCMRALQGDINLDIAINVLFCVQIGLRPVDFWGNCYMSNTTDVELAFVDPNKVVFLFLTFSHYCHCGGMHSWGR